ncbi:MAG TPA: 50S ribosomal protein L3 [Candidatus Pacearchaeota archaeon]|nr:50S ribosomal protein L3 [Candidatus Pacearchaeota archaeon]HOK94039.1 50S ribosomal protein L3 [Candidatus Pacearchaeota archaeon]HPO75110.1 50S ribosomal protein L3 [Candidatus Pacearchaeota archaeon]
MAQKFILGKKIGMSQIFDEKGKVIPLTWIEAGPCVVLQVKNKEKDGYEAVQIGFEKKTKKIKKSEKGKEYKYIKEFPITESGEAGHGVKKDEASLNSNFQFSIKIGDKINVDIFEEGDKVKVSGISKAKGFQGPVKRWGFAGAPKTHGTKHMLRKPGSIGATDPERVFKGKKMAGRMGGKRVTIQNLEIVKVDKEKNLLGIKGAIPGKKGTIVQLIANNK